MDQPLNERGEHDDDAWFALDSADDGSVEELFG